MLAVAQATLCRHRSLDAAVAEMSRTIGQPVTKSSLRCAFDRNGLKAPGLHLDQSIPPVALRDTERMPVAQAHALPDDSETTAPRSSGPPVVIVRDEAEAPSTAADLASHRLRSRVADLENAKKRLLADLADREEQIAILSDLRAANPLRPVAERHVVGAMQRQGVPVMMCSDWHVEEPVDPKTVNGLNEYSLDIADACIDRMADAYEWMLRDARYDCRTGIVWLGGDLLSGFIHEELQESNFLSPVQATLWLQERIEKMLRKIAATCPNLERIIVPATDGNHGRLTHKIRVSTRTANSLEWLLYQTLAARLADDPRFEFQIAEGEWTFVDVFDQTLAFTHGDSFRYGGGVGGISIPLRRGINEMRKYRKIDHVCLGHFHQRSDFGDISVNGSMIGLSPYSMHLHASPERRQQSWFLVDSRKGKALSAPVWL